jgi:hypothetical protein
MANSLLLILFSEFTRSIGAGPQSLKDILNSLKCFEIGTISIFLKTYQNSPGTWPHSLLVQITKSPFNG